MEYTDDLLISSDAGNLPIRAGRLDVGNKLS